MRDLSLDDVRHRHLETIAVSSSLDVDALLRAQTLVLAEDDRADSGMAVAYHIGDATIIRADPELVSRFEALAYADRTLDPVALEGRCAGLGLSVIAGGDQRVVSADRLVDKPIPSGARPRMLDPANDDDRRLVTDLFDGSDPDDVDAAEFEYGSFEPCNIGLIDSASGRLATFASCGPFTADSVFDDIGVLTAEDYRGRGWGGAAVRELCEVIFDVGRLPLYRNDWDRPASAALAQSLGFQLVARLSAIAVG